MTQTFRMEHFNEKSAYGRIINLISDEKKGDENEVVFVNSIDSIKGQEGDNCLLVLTTDLAIYLLGKKTDVTTF